MVSSLDRKTNKTSDLADAFPNGEFQAFYRQEWLTAMIKDTRQNREFSPRTIETARWAPRTSQASDWWHAWQPPNLIFALLRFVTHTRRDLRTTLLMSVSLDPGTTHHTYT